MSVPVKPLAEALRAVHPLTGCTAGHEEDHDSSDENHCDTEITALLSAASFRTTGLLTRSGIGFC